MKFLFARTIHIAGLHWWQYKPFSRQCLGCKGIQIRRHWVDDTYKWFFTLEEIPEDRIGG